MSSELITTNVDPEVAAAMRIYVRLEPLKNALGAGDLTAAELQLYAMVAHRSGLDPFAKQIYAVKRSGKVVFQTGIDGYRSTAERTGQYAGSDEAAFELCECGKAPEGHPSVARVTVRRILPSGHVVNQVGVARWHELVPPSGQDAMWNRMPFNQLAKCAEANALRKAFPRVLADVYITEEMDQAGPAENTALVEAAARPTPQERLAARRAALEAQSGDLIEPTIVGTISNDEFIRWLAESPIDIEEARAVRKEVYGEVELTDEQRFELRAELERRFAPTPGQEALDL
jgi:phage recombination protein Bet